LASFLPHLGQASSIISTPGRSTDSFSFTWFLKSTQKSCSTGFHSFSPREMASRSSSMRAVKS
jgi:hypothetical protein